MTRHSAWAVFVASLLFGSAAGLAHHPIAPEYDAEREMTIEGTVESFDWRSPHSSLELRAGSGSEATTWTIELDGSSVLEELGWSRDSVRPGQRVTVMAWPARGNATRALARSVRIDGGEELAAINPHAPEWAAYASRQQTTPDAGQRAEVSFVGCVELESDYRQRTDAGRGGFLGSGLGVANEYVLVDARPAREELSQRGTVVGTTGDARDDRQQAQGGSGTEREPGAVGTSGEPSVISLTGDQEREFARVVGRQVHIVGVLEQEGRDQSDPDASARVRDLPRVNVTAWHPVNDFCPAR